MKPILSSLAVFLSCFFWGVFVSAEEITVSDHQLRVQDVYQNAYQSLQSENANSLTKKTYSAVANSMGVSVVDVERLLLDSAASVEYCDEENSAIMCTEDLMKSVCPLAEGQNYSFLQCQKLLTARLEDEYSRQQFQEMQHQTTKASQVFVNGSLQDTGGRDSFDIIVDLNIIDTILFGDKMTTPSNGSPFLPNVFDPPGENLGDGEGSGYTDPNGETFEDADGDTGNGEDKSDNAPETGGESEETQPLEEVSEELGFCVDPDAVFFSSTVTEHVYTSEDGFQSQTGNSSGNSGGNYYTAASLGNLIPDQILYTGGEYPDLNGVGAGGQGCGEGEKSFFQGRVCIPEFCNDLICITITLKPGGNEETSSYLDCVECHITRGIEFLAPFIGMMGKNTPNSNPQEAYFLSAFANLFKNVTSQVTLKPKRLPFMVYDDSLADQNTEDTNSAEGSENTSSGGPENGNESQNNNENEHEDASEVDSKLLQANQKLYNEMIAHCPEMNTVFQGGTGFALSHSAYCTQSDAERMLLATSQYGLSDATLQGVNTPQQQQTRNNQRTKNYHDVVQPFFSQVSASMVTINEHLQDIDPAMMYENAQHCSTVTQ